MFFPCVFVVAASYMRPGVAPSLNTSTLAPERPFGDATEVDGASKLRLCRANLFGPQYAALQIHASCFCWWGGAVNILPGAVDASSSMSSLTFMSSCCIIPDILGPRLGAA